MGLTDTVRSYGTLDCFPPLSVVPEMGAGFHAEAGLEGHRQRHDWALAFPLRTWSGFDFNRFHLPGSNGAIAIRL